MPKTPPREEQPENPEPSAITHRRQAGRSRQPQQPYHDDEHPEVPRIRRASLYLDEFTYPPRSQERSARASQFLDEDEETTQTLRQGTRTKRRISQQHIEEDDLDWDNEAEMPRTINKIMVTQRRRPEIYAPPPPAHTRMHKRNNPTIGLFRSNKQNRTVLKIGIAALLILVFFSVLSYGIQQLYTHTTILGNSTGQGSNAANGTSIQSANPHQIVITPSDINHPAPPVYAVEAYLLNADTGATLYAHNPFVHRPMLSTTKLMTILLAVEQGNLNQNITISGTIASDINNLAADSSLMGVKKGETYTLHDLLYGAILVSGNDAATAIANTIGGTEQHFVAMMNQRAHALGLYDTHYMNPHGLLMDNHYSCAHDLAILGKYVLANPVIQQMMSTRQYTITASPQHAEHILFNDNQFFWWYPGVNGGKTGWDGDSDFIQMISVTRNGHHLIGVTMDTVDWWTDMRDMMNWGFNTFTWISPYDVDLQHPIPYDNLWNFFSKDKKETAIPTADKGRYYIYSGYSISGLIMIYFDHKGGLRQFGYPESLPTMLNDTVVTERFDHGSIQCDTTTKTCKQV